MALIEHWARLRGWTVDWPPTKPMPVSRDWTYVPSRVGHYTRYLRMKAWLRRKTFPDFAILAPPIPAPLWSMYFVYLPDGQLQPHHNYTIDRLRTVDRKLLLMVACPNRHSAETLMGQADAVIWKSLAGFDFSAYALGLDAIARFSPGATLFVMNDSVLGPFGDIEAALAELSWDLTAFTASKRIENHVQSYAFVLKNVTPARVRSLRPVLSINFSYDQYSDVVYAQETCLARVAARSMTVGALWYSDHPLGDPSIYSTLTLIADGYPFLKRKLLLKHSDLYAVDSILAVLHDNGHPLPNLTHDISPANDKVCR